MKELREVLKTHAARYANMEPTDAVKLVYQNEFGGGHMIRDPESCLAYLRQEYAATPAADGMLLEDIGNGIVRVHLSVLPQHRLEELGQAFLRSASLQQGNRKKFQEKLEILRQLCAEGMFAFDLQTLDAYLQAYAAAGYPAVSHSQSYRDAYKPAYRIVWKSVFLG